MFKYTYFDEFLGVFLYQAPRLVWTLQQGFFSEIPAPDGVFLQKGKEKLLQSDVVTTESITSYGDCQIFRFSACLYSDFLGLKSKFFKISSDSLLNPRF